MPEIKTVKIYCSSCENWFNSPIGFINAENFHAENSGHKTVECPFCEQVVRCNKENMRIEVQERDLSDNQT